ncbi:hypothetical protein ITJ38_17665 [Agreia pratensis]|uniref:hypothetical protein n=1 Tax=Agreia pratensis TaxID=150121 RepID=UPI00188BC0D0|nr:hypothetical protein [Agreia pratensis]MBF4636242.1 hypothetical protein [Agreia pratensis]
MSVISGEPYFALTGPLPLYRDLRTGDKGDDVTALQRALNTTGADISETGWVNWDTLHAVSELYEAAGFDIPKEPAADGTEQNVIHIANFVDAGTQSGVVTATAPVGTIVDDSTALATISVSQNYATFRADAVVSATLKAGDPLTVQAGNTNFDTTIAAVGDFADGTETQLPGRDVTLRSSDPAFTGLPPGTPVTVLAGGAVSDSLAIPLTAVRQDNDGDYVLRKEKDSDGKTTYKRVAISISTTGAGWAGLADGSLEQGDEVRIT